MENESLKTQPIIEMVNISKIYGSGDAKVVALDNIQLKIYENEYVAIMGASGSGKSTLLNIMGCLDRPTSGKYYLGGSDVSEMNPYQLAGIRNERIGFIFQSFHLLPRTSAIENVMLPLVYQRNKKINPVEQLKKARAVLESVGLGQREHHHPNELSGGQMQRVAIARALINDPLIILADEPTGNLDSKSGEEIMALMQSLHLAGRTIVMVTHDEHIASHAQRVIHVRDGHIVSDERRGEQPHQLTSSTERINPVENGEGE